VAAAVLLVAVAAGAGLFAFWHLRGRAVAQPRPAHLPSKVTSTQAIGLANPAQPGPVQAAGPGATLLYAGGAGLVFTPSSGGQTVQPSQQWQASQLGSGGQYVLLFTPDNLCLTAVGRGPRASAQLDRCVAGLDQRWYHPFQHTDRSGQDYWQLRSAATGRCLAVGAASDSSGAAVAVLQPCSAGKPPQQLIMFWSAY
jgi:Ricin-type beta-trefoil lectin domain-like